MVLCGIPRCGKTTFWRRLADKSFKPSELSPSTRAAESHFISAEGKNEQESDQEPHMRAKMLFDLHLCSGDTDLDHEALTIYKHIIETHKPQAEAQKARAKTHRHQVEAHKPQVFETEALNPQVLENTDEIINDSKAADTLEAVTNNENDKDSQSVNSQKGDSFQTETHATLPVVNQQPETISEKQPSDLVVMKINECFEKLNDLLQKGEYLSAIPNIKKMCHLQDTGGQRAFLELLPTLSVGKALYLLFFNYENFRTRNVPETVQLEGRTKELSTGTEYEQMDIIMQSLICVSTASAKPADNVALLIGTHVDKVQQDDVSSVNTIVYENVKPFLENTLVFAESGNKSLKDSLVLKVAIQQNSLCSNEPNDYKNVVMNIVDKKLICPESEALPASWYMFSMILRRLQSARCSVLQYSHCEHIADRLYIPLSTLQSLLARLHKVLGIVLYFPEVKGLEDRVICDPALVYKSISELIFKSFDECTSAPLSLRLKKWGMFKREDLEKHCDLKTEVNVYSK